MLEGPYSESSYYFPAGKIEAFMQNLPETDAFDNEYLDPTEQKIVLMTHDDMFDINMYHIEKSLGLKSTWFLLTKELIREIPEDADVHIHFDKETGTLSDQIKSFQQRFGFSPRFNRNHRLLWRAHNFDFPLLAMHGICVDTTLIGTRPYRPTINGKILPIWELPFCITDKTERFMATYNVAGNIETPFKNSLSPIVVLSHPFDVCRSHELSSCFYDVITLVERYGYQMMDLSSYHDRYLQGLFPERHV
jgi:hypothetical protein